jgi:GT2 family glycosyltransferase
VKVCVIIASLGRPNDVEFALGRLALQTKRPDSIILSVHSDQDIPADVKSAEVIYGSRGASVQRNRGIERARDTSDLMVFMDDDYVPNDTFLEDIATLFETSPDIVGASGFVIADGVTTGGIATEDALTLIRDFEARKPPQDVKIQDIHELYGCNMVIRTSALGSIRFDERLPLYSWQEDVDVAGLLRRQGRVVKTDAFVGVHRGVTRGRTSGVKFGYSQIANPIYLWRKGTMRPSHASVLMIKNIIANHVKLLSPEPHIDRLGRFRGNWIAIYDVLRRRDNPERILDL